MTAAVMAVPERPTPANPFPTPPGPPGPGPTHNQATCPTCGNPVGSLLAACLKPKCLTADLNYDAAIDARCDL